MIRDWLRRMAADPAIREGVRTVALAGSNLAKLLVRVARDPRVPGRAKVLAAAAAAYVLSPVDLVPDFIPVIGRYDDILIVALAVDCLIKQAGSTVVQEHWDGPDEMLAVVVNAVGMVAGLVPRPVRIAVNAYLRG